jgi:hypothetical protein
VASKPELSGPERDAEIDRLSRQYGEDNPLAREVRDAADLAREPGSRRTVPPRVTDAFFGRPRIGRAR